MGPFLRDMAARRLIGFERQAGPYAVAELRLYDALQRNRTEASAEGLRVYVADTLDDPFLEQLPLGTFYDAIAQSREAANRVKRDEHVMVVICNPPYDAAARGAGKWIESGRTAAGRAPLDAFRTSGNGRYESVLTNQHVYFWRWATWKAFDQFAETPSGVVAFISPSAYLTSQGFAGFREYFRRTADEGWIVDVSPEGHQSDVCSVGVRGQQDEGHHQMVPLSQERTGCEALIGTQRGAPDSVAVCVHDRPAGAPQCSGAVGRPRARTGAFAVTHQ